MRTLPAVASLRTQRPRHLAGCSYSVQDLRDLILALLEDREKADARVAAAWAAGRASVLGSWDEGYTLGHDTGLSARQDSRAFVHGILAGWRDGCWSRHDLAARLLGRTPPRHPPDAQLVGEPAHPPAIGGLR